MKTNDYVQKRIIQSELAARDEAQKIVDSEPEMKDISSFSYDIAQYAIHKYSKNKDIRLFRFYIEAKVQEIKNRKS